VKRGRKGSKLHVALVTPGSSAGVKWDPQITGEERHPAYPMTILYPGVTRATYSFDSLRPLFTYRAYRHYITETDVEISTS